MIPTEQLHRLIDRLTERIAAADIFHDGTRILPAPTVPLGDASVIAPFAAFVDMFGLDVQDAATLLRVASGEGPERDLVDRQFLGLGDEVVIRWERKT